MFTKTSFGIALALVVAFSSAVSGAANSDMSELPAPLPHYPEGAMVAPALLVIDVVKGEPYERAGLSKCDFLLGFDTPDGMRIDLWEEPDAVMFRRKLELVAKGPGSVLDVFQQKASTDPSGKVAESYTLMQPRPRLLQEPSQAAHPIAAMVLVLTVTAVEDHSPAEKLGFKPGDLIYTINGERVFGVDEFRDAQEMMKKTLEAGKTTVELVRCRPDGTGYRLLERRRISFAPSGSGGS